MNKGIKSIKEKTNRGFTFAELMITIALFIILGSVGLGVFFQYFTFSLINNEVTISQNLVKDMRFKSLKSPNHSNYGVHLDPSTNTITGFEEPFTPGENSNTVLQLEQLTITDISLLPYIGTTKELIFESATAKTQNTGSFTIGNDDFTYTFNINAQGGIE